MSDARTETEHVRALLDGFAGRSVADHGMKMAIADLRNWRDSVTVGLAARGPEMARLSQQLFSDAAWGNLDRIMNGLQVWSEVSTDQALARIDANVGPVEHAQYEMLRLGRWRMLVATVDGAEHRFIGPPQDCLGRIIDGHIHR